MAVYTNCALVLWCLWGVSVLGQEPANDNPIGRLNDELSGPERTYDTQAWRAVEPAAAVADNPDSEWRPEEPSSPDDQQQPPPMRRRRPGRKRKRRPQPVVEDSDAEHSDGVRFSIDAGIQVVDDGVVEQRPLRRRPARLHPDDDGSGGGRPPRRRGHRRKQRPYLPNLGDGPTGQGFPIRLESNVRVDEGVVQIRTPEDYAVAQVDNNERKPKNGEGRVEDIELTTMSPEEEVVVVQNDKSYRKPYSQAKRQEEEMAMVSGTSADIKALLKQSGGLSLSELLQQRNLSLADLLNGKQNAISALKSADDQTTTIKPSSIEANPNERSRSDRRKSEASKRLEPAEEGYSGTEKPRRRLPPVNRPIQRRTRPDGENKPSEGNEERTSSVRRRLSAGNAYRQRQRPQTVQKDPEEVSITTTEYPEKLLNENLINEENVKVTTEIPIDSKNLIETDGDITTTTQETPTTTAVVINHKEKKVEEVRNRLSLKPRLRLPAVKVVPKRILNPSTNKKDDNVIEKSAHEAEESPKLKGAPMPKQAIPISLKDMFGLSEIISVVKKQSETNTEQKARPNRITTTTTEKPRVTANYKSMRRVTTERTTTQPSIITTLPTYVKSSTQRGKVSAKDEILEVLTDIQGGERLAKILADRNMTLKELVEHRERGSSQVHLADIFKNASIHPDPLEPFLAKSSIAPISKEIYPLKALLEGNMRENNKGLVTDNPEPPPMFMDITKTSQNEENLGIVTLFDKFSELLGTHKEIDPKDIKKDSDGSSYFTSVINVKPTDEIYRESRSGSVFQNKQMTEVFSSIPTYIKTDEIDAKVVQDWNIPQNPYHKKTSVGVSVISEKDVDGDGLIILDDLQRIDQIDNHIAQASNQHKEDNFINQNVYPETEPNFYNRLPIGVKSAIIVSSAIVGTSLIMFLTIFVACRWRQKRRNLLRYEDSITAGMMRASIMNTGRKLSKNNCSSRSISPILTGETMYRNPKLNTMDSQTQRDAHDYLWDSLRKPFQ